MALAAVSRLVVVDGDRAFWTRSSRMLAQTDELWSIDPKIGVIVDEWSTGSLPIQALSRPGAATSSATSRRATRS